MAKDILKGFDEKKAQTAKMPDAKGEIQEYREQMMRQEKKVPPELMLNSFQVPWLDKWEVGKTYTLVIKARVDSMRTDRVGDKNLTYARLVIREMAGM